MPTDVLRRTASQLFVVGLPGPTVDRETRRFLAEHPPGGIVLFKRNVRVGSPGTELEFAL